MTKDAYRHIARWYDGVFQPVNAGLLGLAQRMWPPEAGMKVLDVGCGTGTQLARYQEAGCQVTGIDPSPAMLAMARQKLGAAAELHQGSAIDMPFADATFDLVTATLVLHEMAPTVRGAVLTEMKRVCAAEGRILLIDFHAGPLRSFKGVFTKAFITLSEIGAGRAHFRHYRHFMAHDGLPALIRAHDLEIVQQRIVGGGNMILCLLAQEEG